MASNQPRTYNPALVTVVVGGVPLQGFADGDFIEIEQQGEGFSSASGADGEVARTVSTDNRHQVTITLQATSPSNDVLSGIYDLDRRGNAGGLVPVAISDLSGRTLFAATWAWIVKKPAVTFGKEAGERAWVLMTGEPSVWLVGGNQ